jgi:CheY-specific phosphatase CheX
MSDLSALDLRSSIGEATCEVFETMLSMGVTLEELADGGVINEDRIVGSVGFAGDVMGSVRIYLSASFARLVTAAMLGMEDEEIEEDEIIDVVGEVSNMIGGDLKSKLCDSGFPCELSIPTTTHGRDFAIETMGWARLERYGFRHDDHLAVVEVSMKNAA